MQRKIHRYCLISHTKLCKTHQIIFHPSTHQSKPKSEFWKIFTTDAGSSLNMLSLPLTIKLGNVFALQGCYAARCRVGHRHSRTTYWSRLLQRCGLTLSDTTIYCPETSVTNQQPTPHNIQEAAPDGRVQTARKLTF